MALDWPRRRLWLLSDAKRTHSVALHWQGTVRQPVFSVQAPQPLQGQGSQKLDAKPSCADRALRLSAFGWPVKPVTPASARHLCWS